MSDRRWKRAFAEANDVMKPVTHKLKREAAVRPTGANLMNEFFEREWLLGLRASDKGTWFCALGSSGQRPEITKRCCPGNSTRCALRASIKIPLALRLPQTS
jgi:hypothetical protein